MQKETVDVFICCIVAVLLTTASAVPIRSDESHKESGPSQEKPDQYAAKFGPFRIEFESRLSDPQLAEYARIMMKDRSGCCYAGTPCPECLVIQQFCCTL